MKWIEDTGTAIVFDEKEQDNMVIKLLCLKRQLDVIWKAAFRRNPDLGHGLREAFETFMNKTKKMSQTWNTDNSKTGEMIAKYVDTLLRGGAKAIPAQLSRKAEKSAVVDAEEDNEDVVFDEDTEVNSQLDQVLDLFRFVHGKAVFESFYKKDLARRLLMGRSASADAERSMLARLKTGKHPIRVLSPIAVLTSKQSVARASLLTSSKCSKISSFRERKWPHTRPFARNATRSNPSASTLASYLLLLGQATPPFPSSYPNRSRPRSTSSRPTTRQSIPVAS